MPHAEDGDVSDGDDSDYLNVMQRLTGGFEEGQENYDFLARDLDPGEKADDAVDYEDFDFDTESLPEEEPSSRAARISAAAAPTSVPPTSAPPPPDPLAASPTVPTAPPAAAEDEPEVPEDLDMGLFGANDDDDVGLFESREGDDQQLQGDEGDELDDLFGEGAASPGPDQADPTRDLFFEDEKPPTVPETVEPPAPEPVREPVPQPKPEPEPPRVVDEPLPEVVPTTAEEEDMDPATLRAWKVQMELFAMSSLGPAAHPPAPPENLDELLFSLFPTFNRKELPRFLQLIPPKKAYFVGKQPLKPPKPVLPTKVSLELAQDQERLFKAGGQTYKRSLEQDHLGVVPIEAPEEEEDFREEFEHEADTEILPGGVTLQDLRVICADWDVPDSPSVMDVDEEPPVQETQASADDDDWLYETTRPAKKRKLGRDPQDIVALSQIDIPVADDLEQALSRIAKKVTVDMNDPHLLLDERGPDSMTQKAKALGAFRDEMNPSIARRLNQRYNVSNDQAYDMLKQNHQNKIRSTLGNVTLEHAMPALRLQWPYYKTELAKAEARSFHRPALSFRPGQTCWFKNPAYIKRKHQKGKDIRTLYDSTKSLSLADNSSALMVEYSEEVPIMLSNFGMSNRFINYYRRKNVEDPTRPKADIGETVVLLPQDKSPFSIFGHVDPGEIAQAISNSMYRAPLFPQKAKSNDFLVVRSTTGTGGSDYFLRNIENLYVAGQQFPSVDVPGPHSRKVTTVAKNRMRMLVYRLLKRSPDLRLSISDVTAHIPGTTDMQNRQKVKDFLQHDKDSKYWVPLEPIPESDTIRSWVHPEDVCLLESMQVGQQHLQDTGYGNEAETGGDEENDEEGEGFEQQMAPWKATRSFLLASQGKAMLKLHGEGDPTGRGEGFSFIKTSMKGGFKAAGESVEDTLQGHRSKELGGHSYNVARQQKAYETSIQKIWDAQKASLSSTIEHSDESDMEQDEVEDEEDFNKPTPRSEATPAAFRRDDETTSQFSKMSMRSQRGKVLRILRKFKDENTGEIVQKEQLVWDPRVIRHYMQHRYRIEAVTTKLESLAPTGNKEVDDRNRKLIENELSRLNRNKERRFAREKQKGNVRGSTGESPAEGGPGSGRPVGTQRKCANCGQVGHIKTNKKLCPMLNGTMKPEDRMGDSAFAMGAPPAV